MAYCYNFKLMFFFYAMISCKHSITSTASSTSEFTTISTVSTQSTASSTSETTTIYSPTSSPIAATSTPDATSITPSTSLTSTATSTSVSTALSPSVSTTPTSSPTSSPPTATSTYGTNGPSWSTAPTTTTTPTSEPTTSTKISSTSETTKTSSHIFTPTATSSSDTTALSSSTSLTTASTSTSESTTLSLSASTTTTAYSTSETTKLSSPSSPPTTTTSTSDTTALSSSASLTTTSPSMSESTTFSLSASTTTTASSTSETTTSSSLTSEITTLSSPTSTATTATSTFKSTTISPSRFQSTTMSMPPNSIVVDLGSRTLGLNFSIRVNLTFSDEYKNKTSPGFAKLSADFTEQLTPIYKNTSGFKYIQINEFRDGSVDANYSVIISAASNLAAVMAYINDSVIDQLKSLSISGGDVNVTYIEMTMQEELDALMSLSICQHSTPPPCPYGFKCSCWSSGSVLCSDRCDSQVCVHGTCYIDHQNEIIPKCRCPMDDDGYVYSGDRCEHKSLSTFLIITSAVGGGVLIAAVFIVCLICIKMRRKREQLDNVPLDNLPNYSKYFPRDSTYQPQYGYGLPMGRGNNIESRDLVATPRYIHDSDYGQENTGFFYQEIDTPSGDYVSDPIGQKHTYDYIGVNTKFEITRPQFR